MSTRFFAILAALALPFMGIAYADDLPVVEQELVAPPFLPEYDKKCDGPPKLVRATITVMERDMELADGKPYRFLTFGGSVPGPMLVGCLGDYVELTLSNPETHEHGENWMGHNIDFHGAVGDMGGGALTQVEVGQEATIRFKLTKPGVFVYHCAPHWTGHGMIAYHVVNGMNGAIMVLPRGGLPFEYDRTYYIAEQDVYAEEIDGRFEYSEERALAGNPSHLVLNGRVGSMTGERAMTANVGESVLFVYSQANRYSQPHIIGDHLDVLFGGSFDPRNSVVYGVETTGVPGGSATSWISTFEYGGVYALVNHNLIEADLKGAVAHIMVKGQKNPDLMQTVHPPHLISK